MNGLESTGRELRQAVRSLLKDRGAVALAVVALSLGIGATTVIFSVVYSILIAGFPFEDNLRVVHFYITAPDRPGRSAWYPANEFVQYRDQNHVFAEVLGGMSLEVLYSRENATYRVRGTHLDPRALRALGVRPVLGRDMTDADGAAGAPPTFLMSDRLWAEQFDRDPGVLGMTLTLNGTPRTLIGILPPRFLLQAADIFFPTTITETLTDALVGGEGKRPLSVWTYARLKPGVTFEEAAADLQVIASNVARLNPQRYPENFRIAIMSLADAYTAPSLKELVYILVGAVLMLLLIACSNVANLLLARATARETELALRASLGASRGRLMGQLLAESLVLAGAGTVVGAGLAFVGLWWVQAAIPITALPTEMAIRFSGHALAGTIGVALLTALVCGLAPALRAGRGDLQRRLTGTGKGAGLRSGHGRLRTLLVTIQVTLAIVLLVGAGLMIRTLVTLQNIALGVNADNVLVGRLTFPQGQQRAPAAHAQFLERLTGALTRVPGVVAVSPSVGFPVQGGLTTPVNIPGTSPTEPYVSRLELVGDGYFRVLGLPLVRGRLLTSEDLAGRRRSAVVNRAFAREFLGGGDPVGLAIHLPGVDRAMTVGTPGPVEIVGMVEDARNSGLQNAIRPQVYVPYTVSGTAYSLLVRTSGEPTAVVHHVRQQIWGLDPTVALMNAMSLEELLHRSELAAPRFGVGLMGTFAAVGLILAGIGVFSVMAYTVSLQTHDIGIRMALGAERASVLRMVLWRGLRPILAGVVLGLAVAYGLSRFMESHIYGVTVTDPWTFAVVPIVLIAVGLAACLLPARRATRVDPLIALRSE